MIETQQSICEWADATFGVPASDASIAARALVEMAELVTVCANGAAPEKIGTEIADVVIILARLGGTLRVDAIQTMRDAEPDADEDDSLIVHASCVFAALAELLTSLELRDRRWAEGRLADALSSLIDLAARAGIDLPAAIDAKMAVNRTRRWVPDGNGHGQHVELP